MVTAHQKAIQQLWVGHCTAFVQQHAVNEANGRSAFAEVVAFENEPCRLSYKSIPAAKSHSEAAAVSQIIRLFIAKDLDIPEGSKLVITQQGKTAAYAKSGKAAVYSYHQELTLELFKEWA